MYKDWQQAKKSLAFMVLLALVFGIFIAVYFGVILSLLGGFTLAYVCEPFVEYLESKRVSRFVATPMVILLCLMAFSVMSLLIVPFLYQQGAQLINLFPSAVQTINEVWLPNLEDFLISTKITNQEQIKRFFSEINLFGDVGYQALFAARSIWASTPIVLSRAIEIVLVPAIAYGILLNWPYFFARFLELIPRKISSVFQKMLVKIDTKLRSFTKGVLIVASVLGFFYVVGFSVLNIKFAFAIGVVAGICRIVPYLDVIVGGSLCLVSILANFHSWWQLLFCMLFILVLQIVDGMFITPRVIGRSIGVHPILILITVLAFNFWFGFIGIVFAPAVLVIASVILDELLEIYRSSKFYNH